jgi:hypothetical protein
MFIAAVVTMFLRGDDMDHAHSQAAQTMHVIAKTNVTSAADGGNSAPASALLPAQRTVAMTTLTQTTIRERFICI